MENTYVHGQMAENFNKCFPIHKFTWPASYVMFRNSNFLVGKWPIFN